MPAAVSPKYSKRPKPPAMSARAPRDRVIAPKKPMPPISFWRWLHRLTVELRSHIFPICPLCDFWRKRSLNDG